MFYKKITIVLLSFFLILANNKATASVDLVDNQGFTGPRLILTGVCIVASTALLVGYKFYASGQDEWALPCRINLTRKFPFFRFGAASTPDLPDAKKDLKTRLKGLSPTAARELFIDDARKAGAKLAIAKIQSQVEPAENFFNDLIKLYEDGVLVDPRINIDHIKLNPTESYPLLLESLKRLGTEQTTLSRQLLTAAGSPSRKLKPVGSDSPVTTPQSSRKSTLSSALQDLQQENDDDDL